MESQIIDFLKQIWLSENEIKVWITLYKYGSKSATAISRLTNINRTLVYKILDDLLRKQLIKNTKVDGVYHFYVPSEIVIEKFLNSSLTKIEKQLSYFKNIKTLLQDLRISSHINLPSIELNEWSWWVEQLLDDVIQNINPKQYLRVFVTNIIDTEVQLTIRLQDKLNDLWNKLYSKKVKIDLWVGNGLMSIENVYKFENVGYNFIKSFSFHNSPFNIILIQGYVYFFSFRERPWGLKIYNEDIFDILNFFLDKIATDV